MSFGADRDEGAGGEEGFNQSTPGERDAAAGDGIAHTATVADIPFFDPSKTRTHA
mgnify:CR=1 FL=1